MAIAKIDFHHYFSLETDYYSNIPSLNKNKFNIWVANNFTEIATIKDFEEVIPSEAELKRAIDKGYVHRPSQCHYSSKALCILDKSYEYWTGFIYRNRDDDQFVPHSFNIINQKIRDFARLTEEFRIIQHPYIGLPHIYFGIKLPREFVMNFRVATFSEYSMRPLLYEWFKEINGI